jgi:hypothetical protein
MSDTGARRMKAKYPLFAAAWDDALARAGQGLVAIAYKRATEERETVIIRNGEEYERRILPPSEAMLSLLIKRGDMTGARHGGAEADEVLTLDEWNRHIRFDERGRKVQEEDPAEGARKFIANIDRIRARLRHYADEGGQCPCCRQPLPVQWPGQSMAELVAIGVVHPDWLWE